MGALVRAWEWPIVCGRCYYRLIWMRVFGLGFSIRDKNHWPLYFSERNGHEKFLALGQWIFNVLLP